VGRDGGSRYEKGHPLFVLGMEINYLGGRKGKGMVAGNYRVNMTEGNNG